MLGELPIVAAPMAGGGSTPTLVRAVTEAGGFGFLPLGYRTAEAVEADLGELGDIEYGVNLFLASDPPISEASYRSYREELLPEAERLGAELPEEPRHEDDDRAAKIALLVEQPVPWVSFTFGLPTRQEAAALRKGSRLAATVTTVAEARAALDLGVDALLAQGSAAGGHSGTFDPGRPIVEASTAELVRAVVPLGVPVVAAGGVASSADVAGLLAAGASAVAVGTLFLLADEAGTSATHRAALADPRFTSTAVTHAFTGRPARGLANDFMARHVGPLGYPAVHHLTRGLRTAAARAGDAESVHLWAGTGWRSARSGPASEITRSLSKDL